MVTGYNIHDAREFFGDIVKSSVKALQLEQHRPTEGYISGMLTRFIRISPFEDDAPTGQHDDFVTISKTGDVYLFMSGYFMPNLIKQQKLDLVRLLGRKAYGSRIAELSSAAQEHKLNSIADLRDICHRLYHGFEKYSHVLKHVRLNIDSKSNPTGLFWEYVATKDHDVLAYLYKVYTPEELIELIELPQTLLDIF